MAVIVACLAVGMTTFRICSATVSGYITGYNAKIDTAKIACRKLLIISCPSLQKCMRILEKRTICQVTYIIPFLSHEFFYHLLCISTALIDIVHDIPHLFSFLFILAYR